MFKEQEKKLTYEELEKSLENLKKKNEDILVENHKLIEIVERLREERKELILEYNTKLNKIMLCSVDRIKQGMIPLSKLSYRLLLLNIEATDYNNPATLRIRAIKMADDLLHRNKKTENGKGKGRRKVPEMQNVNSMKIDSDLLKDL
jgi:hypothetical protein